MICIKYLSTLILALSCFTCLSAADRPVYQEDFEGPKPLGEWTGGGGEVGGKGTVKVVTGNAHSGRKSAAWQYDFTNIKPQGCVYTRCRLMQPLMKKPQRLAVWILGDNSGRAMQFRIQDATGRVWQHDLCKIDWTGWRRIEGVFSPQAYAWGGKPTKDGQFVYPLTFIEFMISGDKPGDFKNKGTIYLDDLEFLETAKDAETF